MYTFNVVDYMASQSVFIGIDLFVSYLFVCQGPRLVIQVRKSGSTWNWSDMQTLVTLTSGTESGWQQTEVAVPDSFSHENFVFRLSVTDSAGWLTFSFVGAVAIDDLEIVCDALGSLANRFLCINNTLLAKRVLIFCISAPNVCRSSCCGLHF